MDTCFITAPPKHEFQAERFKLPYALPPLSASRPVITGVVGGNPTVPMGAALTLKFTGSVTRASLLSPGAVTHQYNMNQRALNLRVLVSGDEATVFMPPPGGRVAPAGWYMLFLLNGDIPCTEAVWVKLTHAAEAGNVNYPTTPLVHNLKLVTDISTGFEGLSSVTWAGVTYGGAAADFKMRDTAAAWTGSYGASFKVTTPGAQLWHVQLVSNRVTLKAGTSYSASAWVRSSVDKARIKLSFLQDGTFRTLSTMEVGLTANTWQQIVLEDVGVLTAGAYFCSVDAGTAEKDTVYHIDDILVGDATMVWSGFETPATLPSPATWYPLPNGLVTAASFNFEAVQSPYVMASFTGSVATAVTRDAAATGPGLTGQYGLTVTVATPGTAQWHVQVIGPFVPLAAGKSYGAWFQIKSSADITLGVSWVQDGVFQQLPGTAKQFVAGPEWLLVRVAAAVPAVAGQYRLQIDMGTVPAGSVISIDNIVVWDMSVQQTDAAYLPAGAAAAAALPPSFDPVTDDLYNPAYLVGPSSDVTTSNTGGSTVPVGSTSSSSVGSSSSNVAGSSKSDAAAAAGPVADASAAEKLTSSSPAAAGSFAAQGPPPGYSAAAGVRCNLWSLALAAGVWFGAGALL